MIGLVFPGTVDFSLTHVLVPLAPTAFRLRNSLRRCRGCEVQPASANRRSRGWKRPRRPFLGSGIVLNAPQVANDSGRSGSVVDIDYERRTVTLNMLAGFVDGQITLYLHTDASSELVAASGKQYLRPRI